MKIDHKIEPAEALFTGRMLTLSNPKIIKGLKKGVLSGVLHLAPYNLAGMVTCPMADLAGCAAGCLNTAGRGGIAAGRKTFRAPSGATLPDNAMQRARIGRTRLFTYAREIFLARLEAEIKALARKAGREGLIPAVRLNGTSDIQFEKVYFPDGSTIFERFPDVQFYDYTKIAKRLDKPLPENYHLSWSYSGSTPSYAAYADRLPADANIAVVFRGKLPETFMGRPVINGDETDVRFLDPKGVIVGLKAKGRAKKDRSGFVVDYYTRNII